MQYDKILVQIASNVTINTADNSRKREVRGLYPVIKIGNIEIVVFPLILLVAVYCCLLFYIKSGKYNLAYFPVINKALIFSMIFAVIGGRGLSAFIMKIQNPQSRFGENLIYGGFVFYGGLTGAIVGVIIFCKIYKEKILAILDVFASILPLGQAIGRIGCYLNGCCYGKVTESFLGVNYKIDEISLKVFPTWFIESAFCFVLFLFFSLKMKINKNGCYAAIYAMTYAVFRFGIEFFRGDDVRGVWGRISTSQIISVIFAITGALVLNHSLKKEKSNKLMIYVERKERI